MTQPNSALPWRAFPTPQDRWSGFVRIVSEDGFDVGRTIERQGLRSYSETLANAELIATAVNSHAALTQQNAELTAQLTALCNAVEWPTPEENRAEIARQSRALLAKAATKGDK